MVIPGSGTLLSGQDAADRAGLWQVYALQQTDTGKVRILADLAYAYRHNDADSALILAGQALHRATQIGFAKGRAKALVAEGSALLQKARYEEAIEKLDDAIKIFSSLGEEAELAKSGNELGLVFYRQGNLQDATRQFERARQLAEHIGDFQQVAKCWNNLGIVQNRLGNYQEALDAYLEANQTLEARNLPPDPPTLTSIGNLYNQLGNYDISNLYYRQALPLLEAQGNRVAEMITRYNIGTVYEAEAKYDSAMLLYEQALQMGRQMGSRQINAAVVEAIGNVKVAEKKLTEAETYFTEALAIQDSIGSDQSKQTITLLSMAKLFIETGRLNDAERYGKRVLDIAAEYELQQDKMEALEILAEVKERQGNFREAFYFKTQEKALKDSLATSEIREQLADQRARYEFQLEQKQYEMGLIAAEAELSRAEKRNQRTKLLLLGTCLLAFTAFLIVSVSFNIQRKKANRKLAQKNEELNESYRNLETINHKLQQFVFAASHDLRESLRSIISFGQLLQRKIGQRQDADSGHYLQYISDGSHRMKKVLDDLLSYSKLDLHKDKLERIQSREVIEAALRMLEEQIVSCGAEVHLDEPLPDLKAHRALLEQLFFNVLENCLQYREENRPLSITISSAYREGQYCFSVEDNGIGIEENYLEHIFDPFYRIHDRHLSGSGLGLAICRRIVELYQGRIWANSTAGAGTSIHFCLPDAEVPAPTADEEIGLMSSSSS